MGAFAETSSYSMYVFIMLVFVERHQHFAKQVVTTSLLIFGAITVNIKMPKENNAEDNFVI
jgi:hypothetical protein